MSYTSRSIDRRLYAANLAIRNAQTDGSLQEALARVRYTADRLAEGRALLEQAAALQHALHLERNDRLRATEALDRARRAAREMYGRHLAHARLVFLDDRPTLQRLDALGRRKRSLAGSVAQARHFYRTLIDDAALAARMADYGVDEAALRDGLARFDDVERALRARAHEQAQAKTTRAARDEAVARLDAWMMRFIGFARQAVADEPQLLEKLGVRVRS